MSYILEALKKSEQERKLGDLPDISSEHQVFQMSQDKPVLLYVLILLLFFLIIIATIFLFNIFTYKELNQAPSISQVNNQQSLDMASLTENSQKNYQKLVQEKKKGQKNINININQYEALSSDVEIIRPNKARRDLLEKSQTNKSASDDKLKQEYQELFQIIDEASGVKIPSQKSNLNSSTEKVSESEENGSVFVEEELLDEVIEEPSWDDFESIVSLSPTIKQQIPSLKVTTHIFSSEESFRKVTINGFSVSKGAELSEGLLVEHILEDGVIFSFKGVFFRMKALEEWEG